MLSREQAVILLPLLQLVAPSPSCLTPSVSEVEPTGTKPPTGDKHSNYTNVKMLSKEELALHCCSKLFPGK